MPQVVPEQTSRHLAVAITIHRPDMNLLRQLLGTVASMTSTVLVHIDGPTGLAIGKEELLVLRLAESRGEIAITQSSVNEGIAAALNRLAREASKRGCGLVLFFDQDSDPSPDLAAKLTRTMEALEAGGRKPAVVGARPVAGEAFSKPPSYRARGPADPETGCRPVDYVITSGSLYDLSIFETLGLFREEYRIDAVDTEWCFRSWAKGRSVWMLPGAAMPHRIGHGILRWGPIAFPRQSETRMESYIRNQARMLRLGYVPLRWKLRTLLYVPLQAAIHTLLLSKGRVATLRRFLGAARSGWLAPTAALKMPEP